jgi:hypothetical protein
MYIIKNSFCTQMGIVQFLMSKNLINYMVWVLLVHSASRIMFDHLFIGLPRHSYSISLSEIGYRIVVG